MIAFIQELREYIANVTEVINEAEEEIIRLRKENAELKNHHENVCKNLTATHRNICGQLANAVLIIKNLLHLWEDVMTEDTVKAMIDEAKHFLMEADK